MICVNPVCNRDHKYKNVVYSLKPKKIQKREARIYMEKKRIMQKREELGPT